MVTWVGINFFRSNLSQETKDIILLKFYSLILKTILFLFPWQINHFISPGFLLSFFTFYTPQSPFHFTSRHMPFQCAFILSYTYHHYEIVNPHCVVTACLLCVCVCVIHNKLISCNIGLRLFLLSVPFSNHSYNS